MGSSSSSAKKIPDQPLEPVVYGKKRKSNKKQRLPVFLDLVIYDSKEKVDEYLNSSIMTSNVFNQKYMNMYNVLDLMIERKSFNSLSTILKSKYMTNEILFNIIEGKTTIQRLFENMNDFTNDGSLRFEDIEPLFTDGIINENLLMKPPSSQDIYCLKAMCNALLDSFIFIACIFFGMYSLLISRKFTYNNFKCLFISSRKKPYIYPLYQTNEEIKELNKRISKLCDFETKVKKIKKAYSLNKRTRETFIKHGCYSVRDKTVIFTYNDVLGGDETYLYPARNLNKSLNGLKSERRRIFNTLNRNLINCMLTNLDEVKHVNKEMFNILNLIYDSYDKERLPDKFIKFYEIVKFNKKVCSDKRKPLPEPTIPSAPIYEEIKEEKLPVAKLVYSRF